MQPTQTSESSQTLSPNEQNRQAFVEEQMAKLNLGTQPIGDTPDPEPQEEPEPQPQEEPQPEVKPEPEPEPVIDWRAQYQTEYTEFLQNGLRAYENEVSAKMSTPDLQDVMDRFNLEDESEARKHVNKIERDNKIFDRIMDTKKAMAFDEHRIKTEISELSPNSPDYSGDLNNLYQDSYREYQGSEIDPQTNMTMKAKGGYKLAKTLADAYKLGQQAGQKLAQEEARKAEAVAKAKENEAKVEDNKTARVATQSFSPNSKPKTMADEVFNFKI